MCCCFFYLCTHHFLNFIFFKLPLINFLSLSLHSLSPSMLLPSLSPAVCDLCALDQVSRKASEDHGGAPSPGAGGPRQQPVRGGGQAADGECPPTGQTSIKH